MTKLRCFIAAFPDVESAQALEAWRRANLTVPGVRWLPMEKYHVTLRFLGAVEDATLATWWDLVDQLANGFPMHCSTGGLLGFPSRHKANVVAAAIESEGRLEALAERAGADRFRAHLTLGRSRRALAVPGDRMSPGLDLSLPEVALYRSETLPEGARYTALARR